LDVNGGIECDTLLVNGNVEIENTLTVGGRLIDWGITPSSDAPNGSLFLSNQDAFYVKTSAGWTNLFNGQNTFSAIEIAVDAAVGSDATGVRGNSTRPFATLFAAYAVAQAGDIIRVFGEGDLGSTAFTITLPITIEGDNDFRQQNCYVQNVSININASNPAKGLTIKNLSFNNTLAFLGSNSTGGNYFDGCFFTNVTFNGSYVGGQYFNECYFANTLTMNEAYVIIDNCRLNASSTRIVLTAGNLLIQNCVGECCPIAMTGGFLTCRNISGCTVPTTKGAPPPWLTVDINSGTSGFSNGVSLQNVNVFKSGVPLNIVFSGTVNFGYSIINCQIGPTHLNTNANAIEVNQLGLTNHLFSSSPVRLDFLKENTSAASFTNWVGVSTATGLLQSISPAILHATHNADQTVNSGAAVAFNTNLFTQANGISKHASNKQIIFAAGGTYYLQCDISPSGSYQFYNVTSGTYIGTVSDTPTTYLAPSATTTIEVRNRLGNAEYIYANNAVLNIRRVN